MGLDMYLYAKYSVYRYELEDKKKLKEFNAVKKLFPFVKENFSLKTEVAYWRKANHIHKWFVDNVQQGKDDCEEYEVSRDQVLALINLCMEVLAKKGNEAVADMLPCQEGFFFGGYKYDEYYYEAVSETIEMLSQALKLSKEIYFEYHSSW